MKKVFFKISQNSYENTCVGVSVLVKLQAREFSKSLATGLWTASFEFDLFCLFTSGFKQVFWNDILT